MTNSETERQLELKQKHLDECRKFASEKIGRLINLLQEVAPSVCSYECPTVWKTVEGRAHSKNCINLQDELKKSRSL